MKNYSKIPNGTVIMHRYKECMNGKEITEKEM